MKTLPIALALTVTLPVMSAVHIRLTWTDPSPADAGVTNYIVNVTIPGQTNAAQFSTTNRWWEISNAAAGTYQFSVQSAGAVGLSKPSTSVTATVKGEPLPAINLQVIASYTLTVSGTNVLLSP